MLQAGQTIDRYTVDDVLGTGGMAVVYRVTHATLGTTHALKQLTISTVAVRERFLQEGRLQATLEHANVVRVTDVVMLPAGPALVMEVVEGPALDEWLAMNSPSFELAVEMFRGIVSGVGAAHRKNIVHRDLKPANVLVSGPLNTCKVTDFGLAKALEGDSGRTKVTRSGMTMGTPAYMAPEQIRDAKTVDLRADIFSLGCILYEIVCGRPAFHGNDVLEIFNAVSLGEYPSANTLVPDLPDAVQRAIQGCLAIDVDDRIPDCDTLMAVLDGSRWVPGMSPSPSTTWTATPTPVGTSLPRRVRPTMDSFPATGIASSDDTWSGWAREHRWTVRLGAVGALALMASGVGLVFGANIVTDTVVLRAAAEVVDQVGVPLTFDRSVARTDYIELQGPRLSNGALAGLSAERATIHGGWSLSGGRPTFAPTHIDLVDVRVESTRTPAGWLVPDALSGVFTVMESAQLTTVRASPLTVVWASDAGDVTLVADRAVWTRDGTDWAVELGKWRVGDTLVGQAMRLTSDGTIELTEPSLTLTVTSEGVGVASGLASYLPDWAGGTGAMDAFSRLVAGLASALPMRTDQVLLSGGTIAVHTEGQTGQAKIVQASLGPLHDGFIPLTATLVSGGTMLTVSSERQPAGDWTGQVDILRAPLAPFGAGRHAAFTDAGVELASGRLNGSIAWTASGREVMLDPHFVVSDVAMVGDASRLAAAHGPVRIEAPFTASLRSDEPGIRAALIDVIGTALTAAAP